MLKKMICYLDEIGIIYKIDNNLKKASFIKENNDFKII